jgi:hypothetical protein
LEEAIAYHLDTLKTRHFQKITQGLRNYRSRRGVGIFTVVILSDLVVEYHKVSKNSISAPLFLCAYSTKPRHPNTTIKQYLKIGKMKKLFYSVALLAATMIGFTSCEEEEKVDFRDQAIGNYDVTVKQFYSIGETLYTMEAVINATGVECQDLSVTTTATLTKDGDNLIFTENGSDPDVWKFVKIAEAANGFTFDIEDYTTEIDENGNTAKFSNYNGYILGSTKYNGAFIGGKLEFYLKDNGDFEKAIWAPLLNDEQALAAFQEKIKGSELEKILTDGDVILKFSCTKK